jgi:hypothetical protein
MKENYFHYMVVLGNPFLTLRPAERPGHILYLFDKKVVERA